MDKKKIVQSASYLLCAAVAFAVPNRLVESEFSVGLVSGAFLRLHNLGTWLFVLAILVALLYRRIAAVEALVAVLCCAPLCFYLLAPGLFQSVLPGDYSVGTAEGILDGRLGGPEYPEFRGGNLRQRSCFLSFA